MKEKQIKIPGPDHPISIQPNPDRVVVSVAGRVIADTGNALTLREADYPAVQYIPRKDVNFSQLEGPVTLPTGPTKGVSGSTAFRVEGRSPVMRFGHTKIRFPVVG